MKTQIFNAADLTDVQLARAAQDIARGAVAVFPTDTVYAIKAAEKSSVLSRISPAKNRRRPTAMNFSLLLETVSHTLKRAVGVHIPAHSVFRDGAEE